MLVVKSLFAMRQFTAIGCSCFYILHCLRLFLPKFCSFEKFRHNLVDKMVSRDLVLRAHVDDAELLIFPSDKLSEKFQRKILIMDHLE